MIIERSEKIRHLHCHLHGVRVTPFWAGTEALIPGGQCGQPVRNETERSHITYNTIGLLWVFRRRYLLIDTFKRS